MRVSVYRKRTDLVPLSPRACTNVEFCDGALRLTPDPETTPRWTETFHPGTWERVEITP